VPSLCARSFGQIAIEQGGTLKVEYLDSDAWGTTVDRFHLTPVVRVGDLVFISGASGGSHSADPEQEFTAAFQDIADTLAAAGVGWYAVVKMTTCHQGGLRQHLDLLLQVKDRFVGPPYPAWTAVGVTELANPDALIEIDVIAVVTV
jgi:enamine deaminase RidA (YjgF/YER057c/UK114 family)